MSGLAHCPHCDLQWSVPTENAGRPLACPVCARIVTLAEGVPSPSDPAESPDRRRKEKRSRPDEEALADRITSRASSDTASRAADSPPQQLQPLSPAIPPAADVASPAEGPGEAHPGRKKAKRVLPRSQGERVNWLKLGSSLNCVYQGFCLALLAGPVFSLILFIVQPVRALTVVVGTALLVLDIILLLLTDLAAVGFTTVGFVGCLKSPSRYGARSLAVANLCLFGLAMILFLTAIPLVYVGTGFLVSLLVVPFYLGWLFVLLFYLRALALNQKALGIASRLLKLAIAVGTTLFAEPLFVAAGSLIASVVGPTAGSILLLVLYGCCGGWLFALCGWFLSDLVSLLADIEGLPDEGAHGGRRGWMPLLGANAVIFVVWLILSGVGAPGAVFAHQVVARTTKAWVDRYDWTGGHSAETAAEDAEPSAPSKASPRPLAVPNPRPESSLPTKPAPAPVPQQPPPTPVPAGDRITVENLRRIKFGMAEAEVLAILGNPTRTEITTRPGFGEQKVEIKTLHWEGANKHITVVLSDGTIAAKSASGLE